MNRSMEAITWAMHARGLNPVAWRMLMMLANRVNNTRNDFEVWPSHRQTAEDCEISIPTVKRHLAELVEGGFLVVLAQHEGNGRRTSNRYLLMVRKTVEMPTEDVVINPVGDPNRMPMTATGARQRESARATARGDHAVSRGPAQSDPIPGSLLNHATNLPNEPIPIEHNPPLPSEGAPPEKDLLGFEAPVTTSDPSLILAEYVLVEWGRLVADHPRVQMVRTLNDSRKSKIWNRAQEVLKGSGNGLTPVAIWDEIIQAIRRSEFLRGDAPPTSHYPQPFSLSIDYILRPAEFLRTLEKAVTDVDFTRQTTDSRTGRRYGPAEQAARATLARLHAGAKQR